MSPSARTHAHTHALHGRTVLGVVRSELVALETPNRLSRMYERTPLVDGEQIAMRITNLMFGTRTCPCLVIHDQVTYGPLNVSGQDLNLLEVPFFLR